MKYFVRTTGERTFNYDIDYELLVDKEHKPVVSFINQLKYISKEDAVLLEDDLLLCKNFKEEIEKAILEYPDKIINFFTNPICYYSTHEDGTFSYNQCTYYPKGLAKIVAEEIEKVLESTPKDRSYASLENKALGNLGIPHVQYRPCLVQHIDVKSLIGAQHMEGARITPYFKDWLDKNNIDYKEAFKYRKILEKEKKEFIERIKR